MNVFAVAVLVALLVGAAGGAWVTRRVDVAATADALKSQHVADQAELSRRVAAQRDAVKKTEEALTAERDRTVALNRQVLTLRAASQSLRETIAHATFHPPMASPDCPGHPVGSVEFVQLYNAAATGLPSADPAGAR